MVWGGTIVPSAWRPLVLDWTSGAVPFFSRDASPGVRGENTSRSRPTGGRHCKDFWKLHGNMRIPGQRKKGRRLTGLTIPFLISLLSFVLLSSCFPLHFNKHKVMTCFSWSLCVVCLYCSGCIESIESAYLIVTSDIVRYIMLHLWFKEPYIGCICRSSTCIHLPNLLLVSGLEAHLDSWWFMFGSALSILTALHKSAWWPLELESESAGPLSVDLSARCNKTPCLSRRKWSPSCRVWWWKCIGGLLQARHAPNSNFCHFRCHLIFGYGSKKGYPKKPLAKGKIDQNLWSLGFVLTHRHFTQILNFEHFEIGFQLLWSFLCRSAKGWRCRALLAQRIDATQRFASLERMQTYTHSTKKTNCHPLSIICFNAWPLSNFAPQGQLWTWLYVWFSTWDCNPSWIKNVDPWPHPSMQYKCMTLVASMHSSG